MNPKNVKRSVLAVLLILLVTGSAAAFTGNDWIQEDVAAIEREYTYTTAEAVAAGKRAADRYWLTHYTIYEVAAGEREFTYTTAEAVAAGKRAADRYWLTHYTIDEVAAAEREFTYTTAEAVQQGKAAAEAFWQSWEAANSR